MPDRIEALKELAQRATKGEWHAWSDGPTRPRTRVGVGLPCEPVEHCGYDSHCIAITHSNDPRIDADANGQYIAAASPSTILKLVAVVETLPALLDAMAECQEIARRWEPDDSSGRERQWLWRGKDAAKAGRSALSALGETA